MNFKAIVLPGIAFLAVPFTLNATPSSGTSKVIKCSPTQTTKQVGNELIPVEVLATKVSVPIEGGKTELQTLIRWFPEYLPQGTDIQKLCPSVANQLHSFYSSGDLKNLRLEHGQIGEKSVVCLKGVNDKTECSSGDTVLFDFVSGDKSPSEAFNRFVPLTRGLYRNPRLDGFIWLFFY